MQRRVVMTGSFGESSCCPEIFSDVLTGLTVSGRQRANARLNPRASCSLDTTPLGVKL